jgi:hypothetical protein
MVITLFSAVYLRDARRFLHGNRVRRHQPADHHFAQPQAAVMTVFALAADRLAVNRMPAISAGTSSCTATARATLSGEILAQGAKTACPQSPAFAYRCQNSLRPWMFR